MRERSFIHMTRHNRTYLYTCTYVCIRTYHTCISWHSFACMRTNILNTIREYVKTSIYQKTPAPHPHFLCKPPPPPRTNTQIHTHIHACVFCALMGLDKRERECLDVNVCMCLRTFNAKCARVNITMPPLNTHQI